MDQKRKIYQHKMDNIKNNNTSQPCCKYKIEKDMDLRGFDLARRKTHRNHKHIVYRIAL
jgi:hypothetical protein